VEEEPVNKTVVREEFAFENEFDLKAKAIT
jgi:hypothetical protein